LHVSGVAACLLQVLLLAQGVTARVLLLLHELHAANASLAATHNPPRKRLAIEGLHHSLLHKQQLNLLQQLFRAYSSTAAQCGERTSGHRRGSQLVYVGYNLIARLLHGASQCPTLDSTQPLFLDTLSLDLVVPLLSCGYGCCQHQLSQCACTDQ
jgi:hypothetical protein